MDDLDYDTIIIGSGVSGMTAGIILASEGEKILILEQHTIMGGLMQTFERGGMRFPTGVHRVGSLKRGQSLWYYMKYLGILDHLALVRMNRDCFEKYIFPDREFCIPEGYDSYVERLSEYFPKERKNIQSYVSDMKKIVGSIAYYNPSVNPEKELSLDFTGSVGDFLNEKGMSGELKQVILGNHALYGLSEKECPLLTHIVVSHSYLNSSFRINEEKTPLAGAFEKRFSSLGGMIRTKARVAAVMTDKGRATGVVLQNGKQIRGKKVIFTGHPSAILDLCPGSLFRPAFKKRLLGIENTPGIFGMALAWNKENCPVKDKDIYIFDSWQARDGYGREGLALGKTPGTIFLSALPDNGGSRCHVTALTSTAPREARRFLLDRMKNKKSLYNPAKQAAGRTIIKKLEEVWPGVHKHIKVMDIYTPATFARYTLSPEGSAYGIKKKADNFMASMFHPVTKVKNLFLTGQSIGINGIHGSLASSVMLCSIILGKKYLINKIVKGQNTQ